MTADTALALCKSYAELGGAVQEQLERIAVTGSAHEANINAIAQGGIVAWRYDGEGIGVDIPKADEFPCWGDHDPIDESCVPLTRADLLAAVKADR